jgi:hypothetical protein
MDFNRIELLLHKYLEGNSTISEEEELNIFFTTTEDIPEKLLFARDIFNYINEEKSSEYPIKLESKKHVIKKHVLKRRLYYLSGIAASLVLGLLLTLSNIKTEDKIVYAYVDGKAITDISIAEKYTKQILLSTSKKIDVGTKSLYYAGQFTNPISIINK